MDDAIRYLTGQGAYVDDMDPSGHLHMVVLRAPVAHAENLRLELDDARAMPGVACVIGPDDLAAENVAPLSCRAPVEGMKEPPRPVLATGKIGFLGEPLAAVIAQTVQAAQDAIEAIGIDYDDLAPVTDPEQATDAEPIWDAIDRNTAFSWKKGDAAAMEQALEDAAHIVRLRVVHPRIAMAPVETRACIGHFVNGRFHLETASQGVHSIQSAVAECLGIEPSELRVTTPDVGGSFAVKIYPYPEHVLSLLAARKTGKSVRWAGTRSEAMMSDAVGRARVDQGTLALDADGRFLGFQIDAIADMGAYLSTVGPFVPTSGAVRPFNQSYVIPAMHYAVRGVLTNQPPTDAYRGAGKPESAATLERLIDRAAADLGIDRFELRRRNLIRPEQLPFLSAMGESYDSGDAPELAARLHELADYDGFPARKAASAALGLRRGIGVGFPVHATGGNRGERAMLRLLPDGTVRLRIGVQDNGQSQRTALARIVAETLEIPEDRIVVEQGDSDFMDSGGSTGGSSMLAISGNTTHLSARDLIENLKPRAADHLEAAAVDMTYGAGAFSVAGTDRRVTLTELAAEPEVQASGDCAAERGFDGLHTTFPNAGFVVEVDLDPDTGQVKLDHFTALSDLGRVIQLGPALGQIYGGVAQGIGEALSEALVSDADGQLLTGSMMDYGLPRADDMPTFALDLMETPSPNSALGVKGVGELPSIGAPAVVMNAVVDAAGVEHIDKPITSEKLWRACQAKPV